METENCKQNFFQLNGKSRGLIDNHGLRTCRQGSCVRCGRECARACLGIRWHTRIAGVAHMRMGCSRKSWRVQIGAGEHGYGLGMLG